jgi:hypothetical protein
MGFNLMAKPGRIAPLQKDNKGPCNSLGYHLACQQPMLLDGTARGQAGRTGAAPHPLAHTTPKLSAWRRLLRAAPRPALGAGQPKPPQRRGLRSNRGSLGRSPGRLLRGQLRLDQRRGYLTPGVKAAGDGCRAGPLAHSCAFRCAFPLRQLSPGGTSLGSRPGACLEAGAALGHARIETEWGAAAPGGGGGGRRTAAASLLDSHVGVQAATQAPFQPREVNCWRS